jgi:hypothetical protein
MIEIAVQLHKSRRLLFPVTQEDEEKLRTYEPNQILRAKLTGHQKPRSVQQNRWAHAMFRLVADNSGDPQWSTIEQVKRKVKLMMEFFSERFVVDGKVYFELRSFAFSEMEQDEANKWYNQARDICAQKLGVDPEILEAQAKEVPF